MLLNLSNHPIASWTDEQIQKAQQQYGEIVDLPFPQIAPYATENDIQQLAQEYLKKVQTFGTPDQLAIHIMGEMNFTFALVEKLKTQGYTCVASTTERIVKQLPDNQKLTEFHFVQFRRY